MGTLAFEMGRSSEGADSFPCEKEPLLLLICTFSSSVELRVFIFGETISLYFSEIYRSFEKNTALFVECRISRVFLSEKLSLICTRNNRLSKSVLGFVCFGWKKPNF